MQEVSQSLPKAQKPQVVILPQPLLINKATGQVGTLQSDSKDCRPQAPPGYSECPLQGCPIQPLILTSLTLTTPRPALAEGGPSGGQQVLELSSSQEAYDFSEVQQSPDQ